MCTSRIFLICISSLFTAVLRSQTFAGGPGDGGDRMTMVTAPNGFSSHIFYRGGAADGGATRYARSTPAGFNSASMYSGGTQEGSAVGDYSGALALPLTLITFEAFPEQDYVLLRWVTEHEDAIDYFTIERSTPDHNFGHLIRTPAAGYTLPAQRTTYEVKDRDPLCTTAYYRLRTTDFDGTFSYSQIVQVQAADPKQGNFAIYPNPSEGHGITIIPQGIQTDRKLTVSLMGAHGTLLYQQTVGRPSDAASIELDLPKDLSHGSYLVRLHQPEGIQLAKLLFVVRR